VDGQEGEGCVRARVLNHDDVHRIRTENRSDSYWEKELGVTRTCVQKARVGVTWQRHPTPPDTVSRLKSQRRGGGRPESDNLPQMTEAERLVSMALRKWAIVRVELV
jgi:hypothetical protein